MNCVCNENWIEINGHSKYQISSKGRIWSCKSNRLLNPSPDTSGYKRITIHKNGVRYDLTIHRLVLEHYDRPCPDGLECDHRDRNRINNCLCNLHWVTRSQNNMNRRPYTIPRNN